MSFNGTNTLKESGQNGDSKSLRPSAVRVPSGTYAPSRRPLHSNDALSRKVRSSSNHIGVRKQIQSISGQSSSQHGSPGMPRATEDFEGQQRYYLKKMKNDYDDDYYTRGISQHFDSDGEDDSPAVEFPIRTDFQFDMFDSEFLPRISTPLGHAKEMPSTEELENPKNRDRLEWQAMLSSVLTGEVVRSEKRKLQGNQTSAKLHSDVEMWLEIRAKVCGRSLAGQRKFLEDSRKQVDYVIEEVLNFQVQGRDTNSDPPEVQIKNILKKIENAESLWRCSSAMHADKPATASPEFQSRCEALISWVTISESILTQIQNLKKWIGNEDLDLTRIPENSGDSNMVEAVSFIERLFKEGSISNVFRTKILSTLGPLIYKAKETSIQQGEKFQQMHLPSYLEDLLILLNLPTRLIQEIIRTRLVYARKLVNPTMMMMDQMLEVLKTALQLAVEIKTNYLDMTEPEPGWELPVVIDENFDYVFLDGLSFYLEILYRKLLGGAKGRKFFRTLREAEYLENEWNFLKDIGRYVDGADIEVAEQFSLLTSKLLLRLTSYFERQLKGPSHPSAVELDRWYNSTIEHVRGLHRKLLRFSRILESRFENACEYSFDLSQQQFIVHSLVLSGHVLVTTEHYNNEGIYIVIDHTLRNKPDMILELMRACSRRELPETDTAYSYVLFICTSQSFHWEGEIISMDLPDVQIDVKPGRIRLVADGSLARLASARNKFSNAVHDSPELLIEQRANFPRVDRELTRIRKNFFKLAMLIITSIDTIRSQCKDFGCQEMINHYFIFAREVGQRAIRYLDANRRASCTLKMIQLSIDWVSFVCDDCLATDKKTFQWSVNALEFAMMMTRGINILAVSDDDFSRLRLKVARCMTLLISHFDIMGARSSVAAALEQKKQEKLLTQSKELEREDEESMQLIRQDWMKKLQDIEESRKVLQEEQHSVGKVLDDSNSETQYLMFLTSSLSNVSIRWQQGRYIGGGTFGTVYAAINLDTGDVMAVKEIRLQDSQSIRHIVKSIKDEMTVLEMLNHPNIVQYFGVEVHREKVFIFMEYCQGGSLESLLKHGRIEDETVSQVYTLQMLEGLAYLHQSGIVHRDIKPENILLDHLGIIKFVDFGAAKVIAQKGRTKAGGMSVKTKLNSMTGTPMYMSPEVITGSGTGRHGSIDIWSMGCCVLEMATGRRPWANLDNEWAIMYHIAAGHQPTMPTSDQISDLGLQFLLRCFERDPFVRASAVELLDDPWIRAIKMDAMSDPQTPSAESDNSNV
ncbi:hypothetical protein V1511DRAFT_158382 [Dipodascopsis uninucleata]